MVVVGDVGGDEPRPRPPPPPSNPLINILIPHDVILA